MDEIEPAYASAGSGVFTPLNAGIASVVKRADAASTCQRRWQRADERHSRNTPRIINAAVQNPDRLGGLLRLRNRYAFEPARRMREAVTAPSVSDGRSPNRLRYSTAKRPIWPKPKPMAISVTLAPGSAALS